MNLMSQADQLENQSDVVKNEQFLSVDDILYYQSEDLELWTITKIELGQIDIKDLESGDTIEGLNVADLNKHWSIKASSAQNKDKMLFKNDNYPSYSKWITFAEYQEIHS